MAYGLTRRFDAAEGIGALERALEFRESQIYQIEYPARKFSSGKIVPITYRNEPHAETTQYTMVDSTGELALLRNYTTTLPNVSTVMSEFIHRTSRWGAAYYLSDSEAAAAMSIGMNLDDSSMKAVREAADQHLNRIIAFGDTTTNTPGFLNFPSIMRMVPPFPLDSTSTSDQLLTSLNYPITEMISRTNSVEIPDTYLFDYETYNFLVNRRLDNTTDAMTVLAAFMKNNPHVKNVEPLVELSPNYENGRYAIPGQRFAMLYKRHPDKLVAEVMDPFKFKKTIQTDTGYRRTADYKYGTLKFYRPLSACRLQWASTGNPGGAFLFP
jgi:hypothetical protein